MDKWEQRDHDSAPLLANETDVTVLFANGHSSKNKDHVNIQTPDVDTDRRRNLEDPSSPKYFELDFRDRASCRIRLTVFNVFLAIMIVISTLMMTITLPLFSESMVSESSTDEYPVLFLTSLWFAPLFFAAAGVNKLFDPSMSWNPAVKHRVMVLVGAMNALNGLLIVYASDPARTSPQLQAILTTSTIPFTVICRYIILRKGVSRARLVCTGVVLIGLFISLEPVIFDIDQQGGGGGGSVSGFAKVAWPFIFALGFLPLGVYNTLIERELKQDQTNSITFQSWVQLYSAIIITLLFWTDFIPGFGAAKNPAEFWDNFTHGFDCMYGRDPSCSSAVTHAVLFILSYFLANLFTFLIVRFAEGAVYLVIVQALVTPLGAVFWTLFKPDPTFHWEPVFNLATAFVLGGLVIMVPAVVMYNHFGFQEAKRAKQNLTSQ